MTTSGGATLPAGSHQLQIQSSGVQDPAIPVYEAGGDPLPPVTAPPLPEQTISPATVAPIPPPTDDPEIVRIDPMDASESSNETTVIPDEPSPTPTVPVPEESGNSLLALVGGVIIAGCLFWRYPRRKEL